MLFSLKARTPPAKRQKCRPLDDAHECRRLFHEHFSLLEQPLLYGALQTSEGKHNFSVPKLETKFADLLLSPLFFGDELRPRRDSHLSRPKLKAAPELVNNTPIMHLLSRELVKRAKGMNLAHVAPHGHGIQHKGAVEQALICDICPFGQAPSEDALNPGEVHPRHKILDAQHILRVCAPRTEAADERAIRPPHNGLSFFHTQLLPRQKGLMVSLTPEHLEDARTLFDDGILNGKKLLELRKPHSKGPMNCFVLPEPHGAALFLACRSPHIKTLFAAIRVHDCHKIL